MSELERAIMVVFTGPTSPEEEDEYNDWYSNTHLDDVLKTPGFVRATRYKLFADQFEEAGPPPNRYLALYEIEAEDIRAAMDALVAGRPNRYLSPTLDVEATTAHVFMPIAEGHLPQD
jgi:hypothetical protein